MLKEILDFLRVRPGYVKEGGERLSNILVNRGVFVSPDECREAIRMFNKGINEDIDPVSKPKLPKILLLDIETAPMNVYVWKMWKQNVYDSQVERDWFCICWSAKWLFEEEIYSDRLTTDEAIACDDKRIMESVWDLIDEADIVIGHNVEDFDLSKLNMRFLYHGMKPPHPYQTIDTLKILRKYFGFSSNKLDYVSKALGFDGKIDDGGFDTWVGCMKGDEDSLVKMEKYNQGDVLILEEVYVKIRPWIKSHPNVGLYFDTLTTVCPNCGSDHLHWGGSYYTQVGKYNTFRCECGAVGRSRVSALDKEKRTSLVVGIAK